MSRVITNLEEILENFQCVLFDTSIGASNFMRYLQSKSSFSSIDKERILEEIRVLEDTRKLTSARNVLTIEEVVNEFCKFVELIGRNIAFLSNSERTDFKGFRDLYFQRRFDKIYSKSIENKRLLYQLQIDAYDLYKKCKRRILKIEDDRYPILIEMIQLLDKSIELKRDTNYREGTRESPNTSSDTDEKLLAALYSQIINNEDDAILLTRDTDFYRLTGVCSRLFVSPDFLPYNEQFRERIKKFPPLIATPKEKEYGVEIFDDLYFDDYFLIKNISYRMSESIKCKLTDLWRKFSESSYEISVSDNLSLSHPN
ncbi:hypothetical protein J4221_01185 [Candidatus Pacearchaeota archaeon]|nr:hypothetical protein [Candidatus Pacearchaeota archaeon]